MTDYERRSFVCTSFVGLLEVLKRLPTSATVIRIKNRFAKCNEDAKDSGGYRDLQLVVRLDSGFLVELQLHLTVFYDLKTKVAGLKNGEGKTGHARYKEFRKLKELADSTFLEVASDKAALAELGRELEELRSAYAAA